MSSISKKINKYLQKSKTGKIIALLKVAENYSLIVKDFTGNEIALLPAMCSGFFNANQNIRKSSENFILERTLFQYPDETVFYLLKGSMENTYQFEVDYSFNKIESSFKKNLERINEILKLLEQKKIPLTEKFVSLVKKEISPSTELFDGKPNFNWRIKNSMAEDVYSLDVPFFEKWMKEFFFPLFPILKKTYAAPEIYQEILHVMDFLFGCTAVRTSLIVRNYPSLDDYKVLFIGIKKIHALIDEKNIIIEKMAHELSGLSVRFWDKNEYYLSASEEDIIQAGKKKMNFKTTLLANVVARPDKVKAIALYKELSGKMQEIFS